MLLTLGYGLVFAVAFVILRRPYQGVLLVFLTKPVIDMFWEVKFEGLISPLYIAGIILPILALIRMKSPEGGFGKSLNDKAVIAYLLFFAMITALKIANAPLYLAYSLESYARIVFVTAFYFVGRAYFREDYRKWQLLKAVVFSTVVPFFLTIFQVMSGKLIAEPMMMEGEARSGFYLAGRHNLQRISGVYEGVYELAFLGLFVALILLAVRSSRVRFPLWGYVFLGLGMYFLYFTYSRSAWSLFVFSLLGFGLIRKKTLFVAGILVAVLVIYLAVPVVQYRFEDELGFLRGEKELGLVGYGRGNVWIRTWEDFNKQDLFSKLIGNYGLGNPENQFLGLLLWFGYLGLAAFLGFIVFLSWQLWKHHRRVQNNGSMNANLRYLFIVIIIGGYWVAGLGNFFITMISTQWILWTWTGILLGDKGYHKPVTRAEPAAQ